MSKDMFKENIVYVTKGKRKISKKHIDLIASISEDIVKNGIINKAIFGQFVLSEMIMSFQTTDDFIRKLIEFRSAINNLRNIC